MYLSEGRQEKIMGKATKSLSYDELSDIAKEILDLLRQKNLMVCDARVVLSLVESTFTYARLPQ